MGLQRWGQFPSYEAARQAAERANQQVAPPVGFYGTGWAMRVLAGAFGHQCAHLVTEAEAMSLSPERINSLWKERTEVDCIENPGYYTGPAGVSCWNGAGGVVQWTTGSGRLSITVDPDDLTVGVFAGPIEPDGPGRLVLTVTVSDVGVVVVEWSDDGFALVTQKPDRLSELIRYVDASLGGIITSADPLLAGYAAIRPEPVAELRLPPLPDTKEGGAFFVWCEERDWILFTNSAVRKATAAAYQTRLEAWVEQLRLQIPPTPAEIEEAEFFGPTRQQRRAKRCGYRR